MAEAFHPDLTCSVCLDLFTEPVLLGCSHCFCQECIARFWGSPERAATCPDCRAPCPDRKYAPNRLLGSLAEKARQMQREEAGGDTGLEEEEGKREGEEEEEAPMRGCKAHGDSLGLFCTTDEAPVCYRCVDSPVHAGHSFSSLQDGAQKYKEKLAQWLESLEARAEELERRERRQEGHMVSLRDSAVSLRANIEAKFSELQQYLNQRKDKMLAQLEEEEKDAHRDMEISLCKIQARLNSARVWRNQGKTVLERKNATAFLLDIQPFLRIMTEGNETTEGSGGKEDPFAVLSKELCLGKFRGPTQHLACRALWSAFKLELEPVELDTSTAHPIFSVYHKGTYVMTEKKFQKCHNNPERFQNYRMILGKRGFHSGKHYWEIETKDMAEWIIGVATESLERKVQVPLQDFKGKIWPVQLSAANDSGPEDGALSQRFGVYLDYDEGQVSFYDAKNESHLRTHRAQFKETVYPFFWNASVDSRKTVSLTICHNWKYF